MSKKTFIVLKMLLLSILLIQCVSDEKILLPFDISNEQIPYYKLISSKYDNSDPDMPSYLIQVAMSDSSSKNDVELVAKSVIKTLNEKHWIAFMVFNSLEAHSPSDTAFATVHWSQKGESDYTSWKKGDYRGFVINTVLKK